MPSTTAPSLADDAGARSALSQPDFDPRKTVVLQGEDLIIAQGFPDAPMRPATILQRADNSATIQVDLPYPGYLVLTDAYFPGWQATDQQGNELTVLKANGIFRAVALPAGLHTVTFRYAPLSLRLGFLLSLLAVTFWALLVSYWAWLRFRVERVSASTIQRVVKNSVTPMAAQVLARNGGPGVCHHYCCGCWGPPPTAATPSRWCSSATLPSSPTSGWARC